MRMLVLSAIAANIVCAAPPVLKEILPRGGQRGTAVQLTLRGDGLTPASKLVHEIPGSVTPMVSSERPSDLVYLIELRKDALPGLYPVRVYSDQGVSNLMLFSVGIYPEAEEAEIKQPKPGNGRLEDAEKIAVPTILNGTLRGADIDHFTFNAKAGEKLVFEVEARRAGSAIDPVIEILDSSGKEIGSNDDAPGLEVDSRVQVTFSRAGAYRVRVRDSRYSDQAQNFYRLKIGNFTYADAVYPIGGRRGEEVEFTLSGGNLPAPVKVRQKLEARVALLHVPDSAALPVAVRVIDTPIAPTLAPGATVNGLLGKSGEVARHVLAVKPGERWMFEVAGGEQLDALLTIYDKAGKKLAARDDTGGADPALPFAVPESVNELTIAVEDLLGRGGPAFGYQLTARKQRPDITAEVQTAFVNVPAGGTAAISIAVQRRGYEGSMRVRAINLPEGFSQSGGNIPSEAAAQSPFDDNVGYRGARGVLTITAPASAQPQLIDLELVVESATFREPVHAPGLITPVRGTRQKPATAPWAEPGLPMAVTEPLPASLNVPIPQIRIAQGVEIPINYRLTSKPGARMMGRVNNQVTSAVGNLRVNSGVGDTRNQSGVILATNFASPVTTFDLLFQTQAEIDGQTLTVVAPAVEVQIVPGYEITLDQPELQIRPDAKLFIKGSVRREPTFQGSTVKLQAEDLPEHVTCEPVEVAAGQRSFAIACSAAPEAGAGTYDIRITSTAPDVGTKAKAEYKIADITTKMAVVK